MLTSDPIRLFAVLAGTMDGGSDTVTNRVHMCVGGRGWERAPYRRHLRDSRRGRMAGGPGLHAGRESRPRGRERAQGPPARLRAQTPQQ